MDAGAIIQLVSSIGFPAAMCYLMWRYMTETTNDLKKSVQENTLAIARMTQMLEDISHEDE